MSAANNDAPNWTEAGGLQYRGTRRPTRTFNEAHLAKRSLKNQSGVLYYCFDDTPGLKALGNLIKEGDV